MTEPPAEGWDWFEPPKDGAEPPIFDGHTRAQLLDAIRLTFRSPSGAIVMRWMEEQTLRRPTWARGEDPAYAVFRSGQNSLVLQLQAAIKAAEGGS